MTHLTRLAPAKVNLYLHVAAPDDRGYHSLQTLVMFANTGDTVSLVDPKDFSDRLSPRLSISGPFGAGLDTGEDNLILKAVRAFEAATSVRVDRHDIHLTKSLPVASGLGGGSADAGAVLHLLRDVYAPGLSDDALASIAARTGADGVMCLWCRPAIAEGYGERLTFVDVPARAAVLVNPMVECATRAVYHGFDSLGIFRPLGEAGTDLAGTRNDLQAAAIALQPAIAEVLETLGKQPQTRLARMSGSGATCFALCDNDADAGALAQRLTTLWPDAWVAAVQLV